MKKVLFGLIAVLFISFSGFASSIEDSIKVQIKIESQQGVKISYTLNFETIADLEKFDINQLDLSAVESCTFCATVSIGGVVSAEVCATATTCRRASDMVLSYLKEIHKL